MTEKDTFEQSFHSKLFNNPNTYIPAAEYVDDILYMQKNGPWKLPLSLGDRVHLQLLRIFLSISWLREKIYIKHASIVSPAYSLLLLFLKREELFDTFSKRTIYTGGGHAYWFYKPALKFFVEAQGLDQDEATALSKALGEMLERMITGQLDQAKTIIGSYKNLSSTEKLFYPPLYHGYLDIQKNKYPRLIHNENKEIHWVQGKNLSSGEEVLLPKSITSWYIARSMYQEIFMQATTSGSAGYFDRETATLRGLLEVIERDGFYVHWLTKIAPQTIDKQSLQEKHRQAIKEIEVDGIVVYVFNTMTLDIPSVTVMALKENSQTTVITMTASARLTFSEAIDDALRELRLGTGVFYYKGELPSLTEEDFVPFISPLDKKGRMFFWRKPEQLKKLAWLFSGEVVKYTDLLIHDLVKGGSVQEDINMVIARLQKRGDEYMPVVYYPTNPIQDRIGFYTAQVYIPKAFPMYLNENVGTFDSKRLHDFAYEKGVTEWKLNEDPHFFS